MQFEPYKEGGLKFTFPGETHTLGNLLNKRIVKDPRVEFSGYDVPHPLEKTVHLEIFCEDFTEIDILIDATSSLEKDLINLRKSLLSLQTDSKEDSSEEEDSSEDSEGEDSEGEDSEGEDSEGEDSEGEDSEGEDSEGEDSEGEDSEGEDSEGEDSEGEDSEGEDSEGEDSEGEDSEGEDSE